MHKKQTQFTPWQLQQQQHHLDNLMMTTRNNLEGRVNIINMIAISKTEEIQLPQQVISKATAQKYKQNAVKYSSRQRTQQSKQKIHLKKIELSAILGIGRGLVGQVSVLKRQLQDKMRRYLLLIYLAQQLKRQASSDKHEKIKQHLQCLFPIIGITSNPRGKYKGRRSLNDLINLERP